MSVIYQADQYYIPFKVTQDEKIVTPSEISGIRISVGGIVQSYPRGELTFDGTENWLFFLKSSDSKNLSGNVQCQVEIRAGEVRQHSPVFTIDVQKSILRGGWE